MLLIFIPLQSPTRDRYNKAVKQTIFVVEDDPDISQLVRHHLESAGFAVKVFPTATPVIGDAEKQRPSLFILDIMVPGKDGLELCRHRSAHSDESCYNLCIVY